MKNKDGFWWRKTGISDKNFYNLLTISISYFYLRLYFLHLKLHRCVKNGILLIVNYLSVKYQKINHQFNVNES